MRSFISSKVALICVAAVSSHYFMLSSSLADGLLAFHLDFSSFDMKDVSGNDLPTVRGDAVGIAEGGGPTLASGVTLNSGVWVGVEADGGVIPAANATDNQVLILDNPILDAISITAGSIVTWINPDNGDEWNNIAKTPCPADEGEPCDAFSQFIGMEFQASGVHAGVFGAAQGWDTNVFGPEDVVSQPDGERETDTPTGEWTHAALTWNEQGDHTIYVDGIPGETIVGVGAEEFGQNMPGDWTIGGDHLASAQGRGNPDPTRYLRGQLADFAIYAGELTQQEIEDILAFGVAPPSGLPCDFNGDDACDIGDLDELMYSGLGGSDPKYDLDGSGGTIDLADRDVWLSQAGNENIGEPYVVGDADLNGIVNASDLNALGGNWQQTNLTSWAGADFDGDGAATAADLNGIGRNWQHGVVDGAAVPEPSCCSMLILAVVSLLFLNRQ